MRSYAHFSRVISFRNMSDTRNCSESIRVIENGILNQIQEIERRNIEIHELKDQVRVLSQENNKLKAKLKLVKRKSQIPKEPQVENNTLPQNDFSEVLSEFSGAGVVFEAGQEYKIINKLAVLSLGVADEKEFSPIQTQSKSNEKPCLWTFEYQGDGTYIIRNVLSKKIVTLANNSTRPGGKILQEIDSGKDNQKICILPISNISKSNHSDEYMIFFKKSGLAWDLIAESTRPSANIQQWTPHFRSSQRWYIEK